MNGKTVSFSEWRGEILRREAVARRILGIAHDAGLGEIRKAYIRLAFVNHPDKNSRDDDANLRFANLVNAYQTLATGANLALSEESRAAPKRPQSGEAQEDYMAWWRKRFA
ncbi:MAG: J domain-containing protein [Nitrospinae bacterium]|nr:J domain-containing protein [Nitrospinota bacterium]MBF0634362.1 J domain-containing protein [Nitrospinota bacterium]